MILLQILGTLFMIVFINICTLFVLAALKELFFSAYVPDKKNNPFYNEINGLELIIATIIAGVVMYFYFESEKKFPNKEFLSLLAFVVQGYIVWKLFKMNRNK